MDINAVGYTPATQFRVNFEQEEAKTKSFQDELDKAVREKDEKELKKACAEFEAYFIQMVFKEMRKTVNSSDSFIPKSQTEEIFQEMLDEQYSKNAAQSGSFGLADMLYKQMMKNI